MAVLSREERERRRFEARAANQQAIGLAALALGTELPELRVDAERVREIADRFFALQHAEGWFGEYGGPDTGYLAVTLDALADYRDATGDPRADEAIAAAVSFLAEVLGADGRARVGARAQQHGDRLGRPHLRRDEQRRQHATPIPVVVIVGVAGGRGRGAREGDGGDGGEDPAGGGGETSTEKASGT